MLALVNTVHIHTVWICHDILVKLGVLLTPNQYHFHRTAGPFGWCPCALWFGSVSYKPSYVASPHVHVFSYVTNIGIPGWVPTEPHSLKCECGLASVVTQVFKYGLQECGRRVMCSHTIEFVCGLRCLCAAGMTCLLFTAIKKDILGYLICQALALKHRISWSHLSALMHAELLIHSIFFAQLHTT